MFLTESIVVGQKKIMGERLPVKHVLRRFFE